MKDWQSCRSIFVANLTIPSSSDATTVFCTWRYCRYIEIQSNIRGNKLHRTNQGFNFLGGSFSNRDNVRAPIQFRMEIQPQHLKRWFNKYTFCFNDKVVIISRITSELLVLSKILMISLSQSSHNNRISCEMINWKYYQSFKIICFKNY